jgi:hypothetical protein
MKKIIFASFFGLLLSSGAFAEEASHDEGAMMDGSSDASTMTEDEAHGGHHDGGQEAHAG